MQLELPGHRNHNATEPLLDECSVGSDSELTSQHHIEGVRLGASRLIAQLQSGYSPSNTRGSLVGFRHELCEHPSQIDLADRDMPMVVARNAAQIRVRKVLRQSLGHHDHAVMFPLGVASRHRLDDPLDDAIDVHHLASGDSAIRLDDLFLRRILAADILDARHETRLAGNRRSIGQPTGTPAHRLAQEVRLVRLSVVNQIPNLRRQELHGREIPERKVDPPIVVVDRLGQMHNGNPLFRLRQTVHVHLELVGGLERIVAADRDEAVDLQRSKSVIDAAQRRRSLRVIQMVDMGDVLSGVGACRADQDSLRVSCPLEHLVGQADVVGALDERRAVKIDEVRITVLDPQHLDVIPQERHGRRRDHRVGSRRRPARK